MTEMLSSERRRRAFRRLPLRQKRNDLLWGFVGAVALGLLIVGATWVAALEGETSAVDVASPGTD